MKLAIYWGKDTHASTLEIMYLQKEEKIEEEKRIEK